MKTKYYWVLEGNVKKLIENEDNAFAHWISAGKELNIFGPWQEMEIFLIFVLSLGI